MAVVRNYGQMQARIADELGGRTDLMSVSTGMNATPIQLAILDAILFHENDRFYFNEIRTTAAFTTVLNQEFYTVTDWSEIPNLKHIDKFSILVGANRYYMVGRTEQYMEDVSINPANNGVPIDYSYYAKRIRLYPIPSAAYPVTFLGTKTFAEVSADADTNPWMDEAEALIRLTAEWILYRDTLKDVASAVIAKDAWKDSYSSLKGETFKRKAGLVMRPSYF